MPKPAVNRILTTGCSLLLLGVQACTGEIGEDQTHGPSSIISPQTDAGVPPGTPAQPNAGSNAGAGTGGGTQIPNAPVSAARDVNRVDLHRLNNNEYDNTMRDLLGVTSTTAPTFIADEKALGFDSIAAALGMTDAQYEQYFNAADALVEQTFADSKLRARIITCTPDGSTTADACTRKVIDAFGLRAWRRPLAAAEVDALAAVGGDARALGETFESSVAQVVKALLCSAHFLYRVELDADPGSGAAHPLDAYELASRLSYLLWSSMPDDRLFALAESGELLQDKTLDTQLDRMLTDTRADNFISSFAGQWLGLRDLKIHQVEPQVYPEWNETVRAAMIREGQLYFDEFLRKRRSVDEFFTADLHFVDNALADLYGISGVSSTTPMRMESATPERQGFLGLAGFLTVTSFSYRTAPTLRGKWVLENLLCQPVAPPPANVPELDEKVADGAGAETLNVRERLAEHRKNPTCASCHTILDPIGLGLENFDAIGHYRSEYSANDPVDASGMLPTGESFDGLPALATILATDVRFGNCASDKLLTYALSRQLGTSDKPFLQEIRSAWAGTDKSLLSLLRTIVHSDPFRQRRGEPLQP